MVSSSQHYTAQQVDQLMASSQRIHFIGIGGSGMYPLVQILLSKGYHITGSDVNDGDIIHYEKQLGISVALQQCPENLGDAQVVIYTAQFCRGIRSWEPPGKRAALFGTLPTVGLGYTAV